MNGVNHPSRLSKWLWIVVAISVIATLPLAWIRAESEKTANTVEIVVDYQDLVHIASYQANPQRFIEEELGKMKAIGIPSLAVFESSLHELAMHRRIQMLTSEEAALLAGEAVRADQNYTYVLFNGAEEALQLRPLIERGFAAFDAEVRTWTTAGRDGLVIEMAPQEAQMIPLDPDPISIAMLREKGFGIVVRLSDNRPFDYDELDRLFAQLSEQGVRWIVFAGNQVLGYEDDAERNTLTLAAELMRKYGIGLASIEMLNVPQKGIGKLAYLTGYDAIRLHSIPERESAMDHEQMADRLVLAVKDRNIRMLYLNAEVRRDQTRAELTHTLDNIYKALAGENGAIARIEKAGFQIGQTEPFEYTNAAWNRVLKLVVLIGSIALIALTIGVYIPQLLLPVTIIGYVGAAGLYFLSSTLLLQLAALGAAVCAPTLAGIGAIRRLTRLKESGVVRNRPVVRAIGMLLQAVGISFIGAILVIGLLNGLPYMLVFEQFRGVTVLKLAPIALVACYYFFFADSGGVQASLRKIRAFLRAHIQVGHVLLALVLGLVGLYYLSRAGNQGQVLPLERMMRAALENALGVRPRTQEFLIGYPLFLVGAWLALKYQKGRFLLIFAVIGLLTMVGTFTHLHTPLVISILRSFYGLLFGTGIGLAGIGLIEWIIRSWRRWKPAS